MVYMVGEAEGSVMVTITREQGTWQRLRLPGMTLLEGGVELQGSMYVYELESGDETDLHVQFSKSNEV